MIRRILLLLLTCPLAASAQMIRGTVTDAGTAIPIKAVNVSLLTDDGRRILATVSDKDGKFELVIPNGRTVFLQAERIGYETVKSTPITATTSEILELTVRLSPEPIALQGVDVVARRQVDPRLQEFMDRASRYKKAGIGKIWTRAELEQHHFTFISHLLRTIADRYQPGQLGCSGETLFIDDMPVPAEDMDLLVAPEDLEGLEVYRGIEIPPDLLKRATIRPSAFVAGSEESVAGALTTSEDTAAIERLGIVLPPCRVTLLWRKPYAELNARTHALKKWPVIVSAGVLGLLLVLEQLLW